MARQRVNDAIRDDFFFLLTVARMVNHTYLFHPRPAGLGKGTAH